MRIKMEENSITLSKNELEQLLKNAHLNGQKGALGLTQMSMDEYINNEINKLFNNE